MVSPAIEPLEKRWLLAALSIVQENQLPGSPSSEWDLFGGQADSTIEGFATDISVAQGQSVRFKINDKNLAPYTIGIYRLGYYQGLGARKVTTIDSASTLRVQQPAPLTNSATGLIDAGNWSVTASWNVPADATSGIYIAKVSRTDTLGASHIVFVVRNDGGTSGILFQTSDTTWQAYNGWGGNSLYYGSPAGRAYKVSYNRPFITRNYAPQDWLFNSEYPMVRWLEGNGYDVSYFTGVDADRYGSLIKNHKVFLSVGHDEYWSGDQWANAVAARDAGVNLGFLSGNEVFWKTRWENSIDGSGTSYRSLVCYKETHANTKIDPADPPIWTGTWRDPRFSPPADGGRPENALTGTIFMINGIRDDAIQVPAADGKMRFWRNTGIANLSPGQVAALPVGTLGYEWDEAPDNGFQPAGLIRLSTTTLNVGSDYLQDFGSTFGPGTATHNLTLYRAASGALVFGAGTTQWSWGLDSSHDRGSLPADGDMQQATVNLLADMGAQPATLQSGLVAASASTDKTAPTSTITLPAAGTVFQAGVPVTAAGTAGDSGGGVVGGVEVSVDGGATWHPAVGRASWTYTWTPSASGAATLLSRATDDSGNLQAYPPPPPPPPTIGSSIWGNSAVPAVVSDPDAAPIEVGVKFRSDVAGFITGLRYYKSSGNTGTHVGHLWSGSGQLLATATFTNETPSGWQQIALSTPVAISANTTYVASYHTDAGHYSANIGYFASSFDNPPLHALANGVDGGNGVYIYGSSAFPTYTYQSSNYWVDVTLSTGMSLPSVVAQSPLPGSTGVAAATTVSARFSVPVQPTTIVFTLTGPNGVVPGTVAYDSATQTATLTPNVPLAGLATHTAQVSGAKDASGNTMAGQVSWSFTTASTVPSTSIWSMTAIPGAVSDPDTAAVELGVKFRSDVAGLITGIRFYKGAANTGTHIGNLWSGTGQKLAGATFTNETASGWQTVTFASPVAINANTTTVASYHTDVGHYSVDAGYFTSSFDNPPLHALASGTDGGNGVYVYGPSAFPSNTYQAANYWVDVLFSVNSGGNGGTWSQTSPADFAAGTQSGTLVTNSTGGEVQLAPALHDDFSGTALSSAWARGNWSSGTGTPSVTLSGGILSISRNRVTSVQITLSGTAEGRLQFGAAQNQVFGLATSVVSAAGNYWAVFSTRGTTNTLYAQVNVSGSVTNISLGSRPSGYHIYRVQPTATGFRFYIDGVLKSTINRRFPVGSQLKVTLSAQNGTPAPLLQVDWARLASYPSAGTFTSPVYDAGRSANWGTATWTQSLPAGTGLIVETSSGNTPTPDATWSAWSAVSNGGPIQSPAARYLRYRVRLSASDLTATPVFFDIVINWS